MSPVSHPPRPTLILVVDDDVRSARPLVRMLREDGFEVELAIDGAAAISRLPRSPPPDVLLTDLRMPHADGIEVARFGRTRVPDLPIVLCTCYPEQAWAAEKTMSPPVLVVPKPLDYDALHAAI